MHPRPQKNRLSTDNIEGGNITANNLLLATVLQYNQTLSILIQCELKKGNPDSISNLLKAREISPN